MSALKLITETYMNDLEFLTEDSKGGKKWFIEGRMMQGGRKGVREDMNANGRIYTEDILDEAASIYSRLIPSGDAQGELNHPPTPIVNPERVCIVVKELNKNGLHYDGKAQIVERSPLGQIIIGIMETGGRLGVSTRALGSLKEDNGIKYVQPDLKFTAIDVVKDPSGQNCFVKGIYESANFEMTQDGTIIELAVDHLVKNKINEEKAMKALADLIYKFGSKK